MAHTIELTGLDGSNPLAFLAAVGTLRLTDVQFPGRCRMGWISRGKWLPVLELTEPFSTDELVSTLHTRLNRVPDPGAAQNEQGTRKEYEALTRKLKDAQKTLKQRKLRGAERETAFRQDVEPIRSQATSARQEWLAALAASVPAPYLALGKALSVTAEEYRQFAARVFECLPTTPTGSTTRPYEPNCRENADFATAFGCEACCQRSGRIIPTEFQLITGSGQQFFLETLHVLMEEITVEKLRRSLFGPWTYADTKRSFRWEPGEDRRYAYGWSNPSGEEVQTEHGANLLAAMALPLFPAVPTGRGLETTGFARRGVAALTWPIWQPPLTVDVVRSLLAQDALRHPIPDRDYLHRIGVDEVFRTNKIEVGRPPLSKLNFTPPVAP